MSTDYLSIRTATADLNGIARGKRVPPEMGDKLLQEGARFPLSVLNLDVWGEDIENSPLVFASGDPDGMALPTKRGLLPIPWLEGASALLPMMMHHEDGRPFEGDPRHALAKIIKRLKDRGLTPIVGTELEFYLVQDQTGQIHPAPSPRSGRKSVGGDILSLRQLDGFDAFFNDLYAGAATMGIPAEAAISEGGIGQFEVNLSHASALRAADDAWLFKMLTQGMARKHGMAAGFLAKPFADQAGNGMHVHVSLVDENGQNIFDDGGPEGSHTLRHALAGCLTALPGSTLIFAPHGPSYDRFVPGAHAPTGIAWAYENRTVALRVPGGNPKARRIEHRVAGGDVNPYLMIAAVLGAMLNGLEDKADPPEPITGNAYDLDLEHIPQSWANAISRFETSPDMARIFPQVLRDNLIATKRQEQSKLSGHSANETLALYLDRI